LLRSLRIENLVLIREAELELGPGLNAITGETGAGKTILAQALGMLLGARADASVIGPAGAEAYVEAELDLPTGAHVPTPGAAAWPVRTWPRRPSG
jgi:DNA repair protein RecN (Recombination protein N)